NALLWKVSGNDLEEPSYLFGTIHMIGEKDFWLSDTLKASFATTDRVAFEIDMDELTDFSALMPLIMDSFMSNDTTLADLLSQEEYDIVKNHFEQSGLPFFMLDRIKPMFLSALGGGDLFTTEGEATQLVSYEMELMNIARQQEKDIAGLETIEFQMSIIDSIPYGIQAKMLLESIQSIDSSEDQMEQLIEMYKDEDLEGLHSMVVSDEAGIGAYEEIFISRRNRNWIPAMEKMMREGSTFFAVGAGHLGGKNGVLALLEASGYQLTPLRD
ncbi:MAG: TraB/GumN family protein, partial [Saprospiraceae bacterium]|nr:TraB/GumN family protein [Saprospiraceae bacterium]